jgi:beta-galactosidase/beta-glucuronidase
VPTGKMTRVVELSADDLDEGGRGYPRPWLRRKTWYSLNGEWDFAFDHQGDRRAPSEVIWHDRIRVPCSPETDASGIGMTDFVRWYWYRRRIEVPPLVHGERLVLRFGAVDYAATVWVNGTCVGRHRGGYTPFSFDITTIVRAASECEIVVRADDDPHDLAKARGKQDWQPTPHSIWYQRTSGIWQTVWLEVVPATALASVAFSPSLTRWEIGVEAWIEGVPQDELRIAVRLTSRGVLLASDIYTVVANEVHRRIALSDPGIDDSRNELLWSPESPNLIDVGLQLLGPGDEILDRAESYTALRSTAVQGDRFVLNNRPYTLRLVLDQGYWPTTGLTPPDDAALQRDVRLAKQMGFNGVRKHQKIEDPRYLYWADRLGLAVWEEMPSAYRFTKESVERLTHEWMEVIARDANHPCVIAWVPVNESWGVPNLPDNPRERHFVQALYHLTRTLDPTRPVIGNDGWESIATDIIGIHDYDDDPRRLAKRYHSEDALPRLLQRERPGGRLLVLEAHASGHPLMLTEFGGIALSSEPSATWGYSRCETAEQLAARYRELLDVVHDLKVFSGFCYTQFADTYQEANGLLYADRTPKFPLDEMASATVGARRVP